MDWEEEEFIIKHLIMQAYPYTWDMIDEQLSLYQVYKLLSLWEDKNIPTQIVDSKMLAMLVKGAFTGK